MTPHAVLESMVHAIDDHGGHAKLADHLDLSVWPDTLRALRSAVHFEMGEARPTDAHQDFAFDLFEQDLLRMPFPVTFWTGSASPNTAFLVCEDDPERWWPTGHHAGGARGLGLMILGTMAATMSDGRRREWSVPLVAGRMSYTPLGVDGTVRFSWRAVTTKAHSRKTGAELGEQNFTEAIDKAWRFVSGATAMLMTPDVVQRIDQPSDRLNAKRAKTGRPPVGERRVIIVKPHAREVLTGAAARVTFDERRGTRPHMRRGHLRTIHRGTEAQRIVPVAPCVVGVTDEAREIVQPKRYEVQT